MTSTVKEANVPQGINQAKAAGHTTVPKAGHSFTNYAGLFNSANGSTEWVSQNVKKDT